MKKKCLWLLFFCALAGCTPSAPDISSATTQASTANWVKGRGALIDPSALPFDIAPTAIDGPLSTYYAGAGVDEDAADSWSAWSLKNSGILAVIYTSSPLGMPLPLRKTEELFQAFVKEGAILETGNSPGWGGLIDWNLSSGSSGYCLSFTWFPTFPGPDLSANAGGVYCRKDPARPTAQQLIDMLDLHFDFMVGKGRYADYRDRTAALVDIMPAIPVAADMQAEMNKCSVDVMVQSYTEEELVQQDKFSRGDIRISRIEMNHVTEALRQRIYERGGPLAIYQKTCPETMEKVRSLGL